MTKRAKPKRKLAVKRSQELEDLREAATAVLMDHAHAISAGVSEGILDDDEEAQESIELNLRLAGLLGLTKKVKEILSETQEAQCTCTYDGMADHLCRVHGAGPD